MYHQLTPISGVFLSAVLGILIDRFLSPPPLVYFLGFVLTGGLVLLSVIVGRRKAEGIQKQFGGLLVKLALFVFVACALAIWHYLDWWYEPVNSFRHRLKQPIPVIAIVELEREVRLEPERPWHPLNREQNKGRIKADVTIRGLRQFSGGEIEWLDVSGRGTLICSFKQTPEFSKRWLNLPAGCRLKVQGRALPIRTADNPGGWDSAVHHWGSRRGFVIVVQEDVRAVTVMNQAGRWFEQTRDRIRQFARSNLQCRLSKRQFRLASAVLLGDRHQLHSEELEQFARGGIIHLVAISGLHVGVLALGLLFPLRFFSRYQVAWYFLTIVMIWFYAVIVDLRPPVTRAGILISISLGGRLCFRQVHTVYSLYIAGLIILIANPSTLFDVGTQLSFAAVATLGLFKSSVTQQPSRLKRLLLRRKPYALRLCMAIFLHIRMAILVTAIVVLITLPLTSAQFHLVSFVGILLNTLLAIPVTIGICSGFVLAIVGDLPYLHYLPSLLAEVSFRCVWELNARHGLDSLGTFWLSGPTVEWCVLFYLLLSVAYGVLPLAHRYRRNFRWCLRIWVLGSLLLWPHRAGLKSTIDDFRVVFINVEHGTAVLLEIPGSGAWLYDAGSLTNFRIGGREIAEALWHRGHSRLEGIFISHADLDHFNAVPFLLPRFKPQYVMVTERMKHQLLRQQPRGKSGMAVGYLADCLSKQEADLEILSANDRLEFDKVHIEVMAPVRQRDYSSDNDASLVLLVKHPECRVLLPGDIEREGIEVLFGLHPASEFDVVMVPHHGSVHSEPELFSEWSRPRFAVVSTGHEILQERVLNSYQQIVHQRRGELLLTSQAGMIEFRVGSEGLEPVAE